jgi:hypothetical protein
MKYFTYSEFDSPDLIGSGHEMQEIFLEQLDAARGFSGVPDFALPTGTSRWGALLTALTSRGGPPISAPTVPTAATWF